MTTTAKNTTVVLFTLAIALLATQRTARTGEPDADAPRQVAAGSVGEGGPSCVLNHRVGDASKRLLVLRNTRSSLCPNTGAVALLVVNGEPRVHGTLTEEGASIQVAANPGDRVIAIVHTIPLHNEIVCIRLGELHLALEARDP